MKNELKCAWCRKTPFLAKSKEELKTHQDLVHRKLEIQTVPKAQKVSNNDSLELYAFTVGQIIEICRNAARQNGIPEADFSARITGYLQRATSR